MSNIKDISIDFGKHISDALSEESDRACVILLLSWTDYFLENKLSREFSKGNSKSRNGLFSSNGAFATFSAKLNAVFCAGWIDSDVYHDLQVLRKLRNKLAHSIDNHSLDEEAFSTMVDSLRVPKRQYFDWEALNAVATDTGIAIFTGERPDDAQEDLSLSKFKFRLGASVLVTVLVSNLDLPINVDGSIGSMTIELPEHMREISD